MRRLSRPLALLRSLPALLGAGLLVFCWAHLAYLAAPKTALTFYLLAAALGLTWLATVPPTAGLVGKLFGTRYLATLFGLTLLSHQVGGFFGAWLGGMVGAIWERERNPSNRLWGTVVR